MMSRSKDEALASAQEQWAQLGDSDPLWAVLTERSRSGGRWDIDEFLQSGVEEIDEVAKRLEELGVSTPQGTSLDFGCGAGRLTQALSKRIGAAVGVDVSGPMIEQAERINQAGTTCRFVLNVHSDLSVIESASIDLLYCCRVLQHMDPVLARAYIEEFFRVVRPGGIVIFQIPDSPSMRAKGLMVRVLPTGIANRLRKGMEMHGTRKQDVVDLVGRSSGRLLSCDDDDSAGPGWTSYKYFCVKES